MKKKHENTIFPSSPLIFFSFPLYKPLLAKYQSVLMMYYCDMVYITSPESILGRK